MRLFELDNASALRLTERRDVGRYIHHDRDRWLCTEHTRGLLASSFSQLPRPRPASRLDPGGASRWEDACARLVMAWSAAASQKLPDAVVEEVTLWLYAHPDAALEYMGRGRFSDRSPGRIVYLDVAGGRRSYAFRVLDSTSDVRLERVHATYRRLAEWLNDTGARTVVTLGGGGYRLFAALSALRTLERVLGGNRSRVSEVWGSSGGALLGYAFSHGHDLAVIDELAFLLYHAKQRNLPGLDLQTFLYLLRRVGGAQSIREALRPELTAWVEKIDELCPPHQRRPERVPFYAVVSNTRWRHPIAFAEPHLITEDCRDILIPCTSREATGASMAVPLLLSPFKSTLPGFERDIWFDGSIVEENPLMLPFTKWRRDCRRDPSRTPKRLKIAMVHLNMRFSESKIVAALPKGRGFQWVRHTADLCDLLLDSKTHALIRTLREVEGVEIMVASLNIGRMNFIARSQIPAMIRAAQIIEGWNLDLPSERGSGTGSTDVLRGDREWMETGS